MFETQGVLGRSRQVGSVPEVTAIERTPRGLKHFASLRSASCSKPRATGQEPLKRYRGEMSTRIEIFGIFVIFNVLISGEFCAMHAMQKTHRDRA